MSTGLTLSTDAAVDLHLHTIFSDGRWTPEALLDHLIGERFGLAAITDHDRTDTLETIQYLALERGLPVLVGVEMTTTWKDVRCSEPLLVDLLCYGFDPEQNALSDLCQDVLRRQQENTQQVCECLERGGYPLPGDALPDLLAKPSAEQMHAIIACIEGQGYSLSDPALLQILRQSGIAFATSAPAAVVDTAHRSGGVCLLAHPGHEDGFVTFDALLLDEFRQQAAVDGLEVYHPKHTPAQTELYREYAERHRLLISAGSDSHKPEKPPIQYRAELCRGLLEWLGIRIG